MSFRKRSVVVGLHQVNHRQQEVARIAGVRSSPLDGRLTTSTGTQSLDDLLAGHAGLALGSSLLIEESGTTDFGSSLLRHYAAEGVVQGHHVHVLGMHEAWVRELPGLADLGEDAEKGGLSRDKMKIAWRYEKLGELSAGSRERTTGLNKDTSKDTTPIFCHTFDLSKRLGLPSQPLLHYCTPESTQPFLDPVALRALPSPFTAYLAHLIHYLSSSPATTIHRVVIPNLLSPALYPPNSCYPPHLLQFLHALRALLRRYLTQLTVLITLPLTLYPRRTGLTRWMELLSDGVLELAPFASTTLIPSGPKNSKFKEEEPPQGVLNMHRLPVFHEKGGGGGEAGRFSDNFSFTLSRRRGLVIKPYSLPPVDGDTEAQQSGLVGEHGKEMKKEDIEF